MPKIILVLSAFFIILAFNHDGSAQVYKYVDKDGVVHFTDNPTDSKFEEAKGFRQDDAREIPKKVPEVSSKKWPQPEDFEIRKFNKPKPKNR